MFLVRSILFFIIFFSSYISYSQIREDALDEAFSIIGDSISIEVFKFDIEKLKKFNSLIEKFFDNVLVNDKKNQIKNNRIKLLEIIKLNFEMICKFQLLKI